ncbi:MAG TPA: SDR family NAD(P)-dependent oxidoreductase [Erysipelotrichaceae bacterium]|nr:SDR family NAD(P)-dependent oxidoreductase [Erysipelotrichaceae bacterium]
MYKNDGKIVRWYQPMSIKKYLNKLSDLTNREILITGGTSGIGLAIVNHLLYKGAKVVLLARNLSKAEKVKNDFIEQYPEASISIIEYDQSKEELIESAIKEINDKHPTFDAIILNAGIFSPKNETSVEGEMTLTIKTNFYGLYLFTKKLLKTNKHPHRYIFQGSFSVGYRLKKITSLRDKNISKWQQYLISKSGVESLFYHYCKYDKGPSSFYLVEPGLTGTDIIRDFITPFRQISKAFLKLFTQSNKKAALPALLALDKETKNHSFIIPRGMFSLFGYPKIHPFPEKRIREYLYDLAVDIENNPIQF